MQITSAILEAAANAAETMNAETECVHVRSDGTCTTGTDGKTTRPAAGWGDVVYTFHPERAEDPWDCFRAVDSAQVPTQGFANSCRDCGEPLPHNGQILCDDCDPVEKSEPELVSVSVDGDKITIEGTPRDGCAVEICVREDQPGGCLVWAGTGTWDGSGVECTANLGDDVYDAIDAALLDATLHNEPPSDAPACSCATDGTPCAVCQYTFDEALRFASAKIPAERLVSLRLAFETLRKKATLPEPKPEPKPEPCDNCEDRGWTHEICLSCNGSGEDPARRGGGTCSRCKGSGEEQVPCSCEAGSELLADATAGRV